MTNFRLPLCCFKKMVIYRDIEYGVKEIRFVLTLYRSKQNDVVKMDRSITLSLAACDCVYLKSDLIVHTKNVF